MTLLLILGLNLVLTLSLGYILRNLMKQFIHPSHYDFANEMVSTFELSAFIFELGVFDRVYGVAPTFFCAFSLLLAKNYNLMFQGRPANPCGVVEHAFGQLTPKHHLLVLWMFQLLGALIAYPYISLLWIFSQSSHHLDYLQYGFQPQLKVGVFLGFIVELLATFCCNFIDFSTRTKPYDTMNPWIRAISCVGMAFLLAETTGVWMNPALATAHSFQFKSDYVLNHFIVYWLGPIFGVTFALVCYAAVQNNEVNKDL